jgi:hypothetical protein
MNPRIRKLVKQAGGEFWQRLENDTVNPEAYITFDPPESLEKFVELIVKECISVPYAMWDQAELNADIAVKIEHRIREHFGVEQ